MPLDVSGWNSNSIIFNDIINKIKPEIIVEVGTWKGASAIHMANICKQNNLNTTIYCVDTWLGSAEFYTFLKNTPGRDLLTKNGYPQIYYQFLSNVVLSGHADRIIPITNTSDIGYKILDSMNIKADIIYIDASHDYDSVKNDIKNYLNLLKDDGIMFGDDYMSWSGVKLAVDEILQDKQIIENNFWLYDKAMRII